MTGSMGRHELWHQLMSRASAASLEAGSAFPTPRAEVLSIDKSVRARSNRTKPLANAKAHVGCVHVLNVDIKDFFPSITADRVHRVFESLGYSATVSNSLTELVTFGGTLPQGAPTSPMIANLIFADLDAQLKQLAEGSGLIYTRYADDLTFSSKGKIDADFPDRVKILLAPHGFELNEKKTRFMGLNQVKEVTGIVVGEHSIALRREYLNSVRGWLNRICTDPSKFSDALPRVRGTVEFIKQVGGRGSSPVIAIGERAIAVLQKPKLAGDLPPPTVSPS